MAQAPIIVVSMGDPLGIGSEVVVKALDAVRGSSRCAFVVLGSTGALQRAAAASGITPFWDVTASWPGVERAGQVVVVHDGSDFADDGPPRATAQGGAFSFEWVERGIAACLGGRAAALVTGPINKEAWALAGHQKFPGHTELLAARCRAAGANTGRARMMFVAPNLMTMLVTTHQSLASVSASITEARVFDTITMAHESCERLGAFPAGGRPRIAVCGLNPHASEGGLFGDEEARAIIPAIERARDAGIDASGPYPGDTIFGAAVRGKFDMVVAMYHDQGLIPVKLLAFDRAVNVTVGLPIIRTSPDHGTAYDIAGQNKADAGSMRAALELAERLVVR
ncbi:MAG: 4-hydroxythreonine-4-phosphate dehydrogenase PdxA [Phycisphaerales bacterium]